MAKKEKAGKPAKAEKAGASDASAYEKKMELVASLKEKAKEARSAFQSFTKKNNLSQKEAPVDKKLKPEWKKLKEVYDAAKAERDKAEEEAKAVKPATKRVTKYDYPPDVVTADDKKKFRARMRTANKPKDEAPAKSKKSKKASKKEEAPVKNKKASKKEEAPAKKGKKVKKAKKASSED